MMYPSKTDAQKAADVMSKNMVFISLYINVFGVMGGISGKTAEIRLNRMLEP